MAFEEYVSKPVKVNAEQAEQDGMVVTFQGVRPIAKGDYLVEVPGVKTVLNEETGEYEEVTYSTGHKIVTREEFEAEFKKAPKRALPGKDDGKKE